MNYIIDNKILFDSDKKQISALSRPDVLVPLTTTASRLLEEMLRHPHQVLPRPHLLKKVWEDNGYAPSDASLNNNISQLRKYFMTLSNAEIDLRTVPKIGFQLNASVSSVRMEEEADSEVFSEPSSALAETHFVPRLERRVIFLICGIIAFFFTSVAIIHLKSDSPFFLQKKLQKVTTYGKCNVFSLTRNGPPFSLVLSTFPSVKDKCEYKPSNLYYDFSSYNKDRAKNFFVAICEPSESTGYLKCENIKSYSQF